MITLEELKTLVAAGKVPMIYYSPHTLWWTHSEKDLAEATEQGHKHREEQHGKFMADPTTSEVDKKKMDALFKLSNSSPHKMPVDPTGAPLYQMDKPDKWISGAEAKPTHFGRHGLEGFMKSHHQNCEGVVGLTWETYNLLIDKEKYK